MPKKTKTEPTNGQATAHRAEPKDDGKRYRIVRMFRDHTPNKRQVRGMSGLTLAQAQKHCQDPETSSSTCRTAAALKRTQQYGAWFDGYEVDR